MYFANGPGSVLGNLLWGPFNKIKWEAQLTAWYMMQGNISKRWKRVGSVQFRFTVCRFDQILNYSIGTQAQTQTMTQLSWTHKNHTNYISFQLTADQVHSQWISWSLSPISPKHIKYWFWIHNWGTQQISLSSPTLVTDLMFIFFMAINVYFQL